MFTSNIVLCAPVRTAIGTYNGSLKHTPATELGAAVVSESIRRAGIKAELIDSVVMGNVVQAGNRMNPARQAAIKGGVSIYAPALTVNRVCGSGAQAIVNAAQDVALGVSKISLAGGMENMDMAPYLVSGGRWGYRMGDAEMHDSMLRDGLRDAFSGEHSGWHTEDLIAKYELSREEQDLWALRSQQRFAQAQQVGLFRQEIMGLELETKTGTVVFNKDESNRPDTKIEVLSQLKPAFRKRGTLTAGNSPGLNSGAAAMIVTTAEIAKQYGLEPMARLVSYAISAVEPGMFGIAPASAIKLALTRAKWKLNSIQRIEINEAYAAVPLAVIKKLELAEDIVNVEGGAIAHGHPIGATGAVLTTRLIYSMRRAKLQRGVVSLCIGGGQGIALVIEVL